VKTGDTCNSVAGAAGISVNTLLQNNPNVNKICTNLYIGEVNKFGQLTEATIDDFRLSAFQMRPM